MGLAEEQEAIYIASFRCFPDGVRRAAPPHAIEILKTLAVQGPNRYLHRRTFPKEAIILLALTAQSPQRRRAATRLLNRSGFVTRLKCAPILRCRVFAAQIAEMRAECPGDASCFS
jgi:hypothetical protein